MSAFKVSMAFLEGPVSTIISKSSHIAKSLKKNLNFPYPPITPEGMDTAIDHLKQMENLAKRGGEKAKANRDEALADVDDYIRQHAAYVNHAASYDLEKLKSSGFDMLVEEKKAVVHATEETL